MNTPKENNLKLVGQLDRNFNILPHSLFSDSERKKYAQLIANKGSFPTLLVRTEEGKWLTLHSPTDPFKEAEKFAENLPITKDKILVILGLGLGYHLLEIGRKIQPGQPIIIVEPNQAIWEQALQQFDLTELLQRPHVYWLVYSDEKEILRYLSKIQLRHHLAEFFPVLHPPSFRSKPSFYSSLIHHLEASKRVNIRDRLRYKKFNNRNVKILLLSTKYFLIGEIIRSLNRMGHLLHFVMIEEKEMGKEEVMEGIIREIISFQPDFVLTINHLGFDVEGFLARFFTSIELAFASWYVDSPTLILRHYENNRSPFLSLFLWDRDYLQDMKVLGFERCYFLPLAADEEVFCPISPPPDKPEKVGYPISFVGNSMVQKIEERLRRIDFDFAFLPQFYELSDLFTNSPKRHAREMIQSMGQRYSCLDTVRQEDRIDLEIAITQQATLNYRLRIIQALAPLHPHIFGDEGWNDLLDGHFAFHPGVSYVDGLPLLYNQSDINFNATSLQMRNGLNQRVFDVPACGSFLLTDFGQQIEELFRVGKEVICYRDEKEALDLARFFLKNESAKEKIAMAGRKRVLQEHCYTHRLDFLIERMREDYA